MSIIEHISHSWNSTSNGSAHNHSHEHDFKDSGSDIEAPLSHDHENAHPNHNGHNGRDEHNHTCISNLTSSSRVNAALQTKGRNKKLSLYFFEFACIFHSLVIGISLGVISDASVVHKLTIALSFHQFLEGIGLGSMLVDAMVSKWKMGSFVVCYSLTTPVGILLGSMVDTYYIQQQHIVQGCFEAFAAGMLLYISLIQQIAEEFSKDDLHDTTKVKLKYSMYLALITGAASMCCIALYV